ncbi:hypothetical protein DFS34DRAFT_647025 [Phlyctochytrium arcticum]|nr:hypothetical protein DFS34DRAFT_647025 [Phlyctochytrium arcticum]
MLDSTSQVVDEIKNILSESSRPLTLQDLQKQIGESWSNEHQNGLEELESIGSICRKQFDNDEGSPSLTLYWISPPALPCEPVPNTLEVSNPAEAPEIAAQRAKLLSSLSPVLDSGKDIAAYMKLLHDYNEIKDVGQILLGKCAEMEGSTTREMYERFALDVDD